MNIFSKPKTAHSLEFELTSILLDGSTPDLSKQQLLGIALASAHATGNSTIVRDLISYAREYAEDSTITLSRAAVSQVQSDPDCEEPQSHTDCTSDGDNVTSEHSQTISDLLLNPPSSTNIFFNAQRQENLPAISNEPRPPEQLGYDTNLYVLAAAFVKGKDICMEIGAEFVCDRLINKNILMTIVRIAALIEAIASQVQRAIEKTHKVLLVDDDVRLTRRLKLSLERKTDFMVRTENNSLSVLDTVREFSPDLIVLDLYMPQRNGDEVLRMLQADPELSKIDVIFLTSLLTREEAGKKGKEIQGHLFMAKPVEDHALIDNMRNLLFAGNLVAT